MLCSRLCRILALFILASANEFSEWGGGYECAIRSAGQMSCGGGRVNDDCHTTIMLCFNIGRRRRRRHQLFVVVLLLLCVL